MRIESPERNETGEMRKPLMSQTRINMTGRIYCNDLRIASLLSFGRAKEQNILKYLDEQNTRKLIGCRIPSHSEI